MDKQRQTDRQKDWQTDAKTVNLIELRSLTSNIIEEQGGFSSTQLLAQSSISSTFV